MSNLTNNRWLPVIILLLITANIVTLALLWTNKGKEPAEVKFPEPPGGGQVFMFLTNELKLDPAQQEAYRKMRDEHRAGQRGLQDSIRSAKDALFALLRQPGTNDSMIATCSRKAADAEQELDEYTFRHFQKLRSICNKEQQKKFDKIIQDVLHRMAPRRQGPPPGMMRPEDGPPPPPPGS